MEALAATAENLATLGPKTTAMLVVSVTFLCLTWIAFSLRIFVRAFMIRSWGMDDWTMLLTLVMYTSCCGLLIAVQQYESDGRPQKAAEGGLLVELALIEKIMTFIITFMGIYILTTVTLKISLAIFFLRVVVKKWQRRVIWITASIYSTYGVFFAFLAVFQCGNPKNTIVLEAANKCVPNDVLQPLNYLHGSLNAASDWTFALLPVLVLWHSKIPRPAKLSAGLLLSLGTVGSISSLIRLVYVPGLKSGPNFFHDAINIGVWSIIEPGLGIVAASLATLRPLFRTMMEKTRNPTPSRSNNHSHTQSQSRNSKLSIKNKARYSGFSFSDKGYLPMDNRARAMGNFTSVIGDMKSSPHTKNYELEEMGPRVEQTTWTTHTSIRAGSNTEIKEVATPGVIGSLQNGTWFPDDEVLMTRDVNIYDEEAC